MKNAVLLLVAIFCGELYSQPSAYSYQPDATTSITRKRVSESSAVRDITPDFKKNFVIPYHDMMKLDELFKKTEYPPTFALAAAGNTSPSFDSYMQLIRIVSTAVVIDDNGKTVISRSDSDLLNAEQKRLLISVTPGSMITLQLGFVYRHDKTSDTIYGKYRVKVLPDLQAGFPGGPGQLAQFLDSHFLSRIKAGGAIPRQSTITFIVDEEGQIHDPRITRSSGREDVDHLLKEAAACMPDWKPATDQGEKVKQQVTLSFGYNGGC